MQSQPAEARRAARYWLVGSLVFGAIAVCMQWPNAPAALTTTTTAGAARATAAKAATACADELGCSADQALAAAGPACSQAIAQLAAYSLRWTTSGASDRFPRRAWSDALLGTINYGGDNAEFEDGSGNYRRVRYECDFDPGQRAVLDVRIRPG